MVSVAGVSRATFYALFTNKEECVLAAYDLVVGWLETQVRDALAGIEDWTTGVEAAVRAILSSLDVDPRLAPFCAIEILRLGPDGLSRYESSIERLAAPLGAGREDCPWGSQLPGTLEQITVGGAVWVVANRAQRDSSTRLVELTPDIVHFLLIPYRDPGPARPEAARQVHDRA
jgi:AcrR family transcriptional regulator